MRESPTRAPRQREKLHGDATVEGVAGSAPRLKKRADMCQRFASLSPTGSRNAFARPPARVGFTMDEDIFDRQLPERHVHFRDMPF